MAVVAVVSGVIQKLTDMLKEESLSHNAVIVKQLGEIRKSLKNMRGYLIVAEDKSDTNLAAKNWAGKYLETLYLVEDEIEKFAFRVARQRKRLGFLMNHASFFNNLNACRKLRRTMKKVQVQIKKLNNAIPKGIDTASPTTTLSLSSSFGEGQQSQRPRQSIDSNASDSDPHEEEDIEDENVIECESSTNALQHRNNPALSQVHTVSPNNTNVTHIRSLSAVSPTTQQRKKLTFSYSCNQKETQIVGFKDERLKYPKHLSSFSYEEEELGIFGLRDDVDTLVKRLTKKGERFVSIVGEVGSGKTTLARAIYRSSKIKDCFDYRHWVSISKEYEAGEILLSVLKVVDNLKDDNAMILDQHAMKTRLFECLSQKRYLLVLDGARTCDVWNDLKEAFPDKNNGSKIIFTSCEVCTSAETSVIPHSLKRLSEEDSWRMFLKKAGKEKKESLILDLKQRILEVCKGLPLNIVLIAGLFSTKKRSSWPPELFGEDSNDILTLCYSDLSINPKLCLLHMGLFPKGYDIPVRRLLRLWLAEGFVKRRSEKIPPEDLVQRYFEDLVNRSMIQISKLRSDNSPRKCRLLGVLHDYLLPRAQDISLFYIHRTAEFHEDSAGPFGVRRMVEYVDAKGVFAKIRENGTTERMKTEKVSLLSYLSNFFASGKLGNNSGRIENSTTPSLSFDINQTKSKNFAHDPSLLRSYMSFNFQKKDTPAKEVGRLLGRIIDNGFGLLRVLDLEGVYKPSLPEKLGDLYHLRYLGLRWTFLDSLPQSVGDLPYLETLDVKHTFINSVPDSIWKLKRLRHLNLNDIRLAMPPRSSPTLLTLWGLFVDEKIPVKNGLDKLCHLKELGMSFNLSSSQGDLLDWIAKLTALQSLRLRSKDGAGAGRASNLALKPLSNLSQLSHLNLFGILDKLPAHSEFPPTLKVLTLSNSRLATDPMRTLGQLPGLTVLRLLGSSYKGKYMVCLKGGFGKLKVLKLWVLEDLEDWDVEEGAMKSLKELNIRRCNKLKTIPPRLLQLRTLEDLILTGMPDRFTNLVRQRKSKDTSLVVNELKSTLPGEQDNVTSERGKMQSINSGSSVTRPVEVEAKAESVNGLKLPCKAIKSHPVLDI